MAFGLKLSRIRGGQPNSASTDQYDILSTYATKLHKGDPVILVAGYLNKGTAAGAIMGVFNGVEYIDLNGKPTFSNWYLGATTGTEHKALVSDDLDGLFIIESSAGTVAQTDIGKYASLTLTAGSDITGISNAVLNEASINAASAGLNVRILRIVEQPTDGNTSQVVEVERVR